jgi:hypothetical protein
LVLAEGLQLCVQRAKLLMHLRVIQTALRLEQANVVLGHNVLKEALMDLFEKTEASGRRLSFFHLRKTSLE